MDKVCGFPEVFELLNYNEKLNFQTFEETDSHYKIRYKKFD